MASSYNERSGGLLNRAQYPSDVIALVVLWRLRYKLALRDLPEMFALRGIVFSHQTVREWEAKLTPALAEALRRRRKGKAGCSWYVDETYIKMHGHQGARALVLALSRDRSIRRTGGRDVQPASRHGRSESVVLVSEGCDRHRA